MNKSISIAIPIYEYSGKGTECLNFSLNKFLFQTFQDFEIIDDSITDTEQDVFTHVTASGNAFGGDHGMDYSRNFELTCRS